MKKFWSQLKERLSQKEFTASTLFSLVKYGEILDDASIRAKYIKEVTEIVQNRAMAKNIYSTVIDLEGIDSKYVDFLVEYFRARKFICNVIDSSVLDFVESPKLYIGWKIS